MTYFGICSFWRIQIFFWRIPIFLPVTDFFWQIQIFFDGYRQMAMNVERRWVRSITVNEYVVFIVQNFPFNTFHKIAQLYLIILCFRQRTENFVPFNLFNKHAQFCITLFDYVFALGENIVDFVPFTPFTNKLSSTSLYLIIFLQRGRILILQVEAHFEN